MTSPAGTPSGSHVSISSLPEFSPWMRRLPASAGSVISFLLIYEDPTPLVQSLGTHLNNISPAPAADHSMHCFRRWMTYETWWVGCMNYLRPSFLRFSFHRSVPPFPFLFQNESCDDPWFLGVGLIHGRHSERHFVFGSSVVLYDSEFSGMLALDGSFDLFNSPLVTS